jgi:pyruvate-formate lyase
LHRAWTITTSLELGAMTSGTTSGRSSTSLSVIGSPQSGQALPGAVGSSAARFF